MKKILLLIALIFCATTSFAAFDAFLKLGDIKGESTDKDHKDWIELSSYSMSPTHGQKGITLRAHMGAWSAQVGQAVAIGKHFKTVVLDAGPVRYTLDDVMISSYSAGGAGKTNGLEATFILSYGNLTMATQQRPNTTTAPPTLVEATLVSPNVTLSPNAQVFVDAAASDRFTLISFERRLDRSGGTGVLHLRNLQGNAYFAANRAKNTKVVVKANAGQFLDIQMTNCVISSYSRNADGTATATFTFSLYNGPASVRP